MPRITPIPTTRVSDMLAQQRLLNQLQSDQVDVLRLQQQIATGRRIQFLSEDAPAGLRGVTLQRLLEQKAQVATNLRIDQDFLTTTDTALSGLSNELAQARAGALGVTGSVATDTEREAVALELDETLQRLLNTSNQDSRGRYLFAGSRTSQLPFTQIGNYVRYNGNENHLQDYGDINLLFNTNVTGDEAFGALSKAVGGTTDLNPILTAQTKLTDVNQGRGVSVGSIEISDGTSSSIINLNSAHTVGDVVALIEAKPPTGRTLSVEITPTGLNVSLDAAGGGNLRIKEVGGGTSAHDLGILAETNLGTGPIVGGDLDPRVVLTTRLSDAFGARAYTLLDSTGGNNSLRIEANTRGAAFNGYSVNFADDSAAGAESVTYNGGTQTYTVHYNAAASTASQVRDALNAEPLFNVNFTASLDTTLDAANNGSGTIASTTTAITALGSGIEFDQTSGLQILNGDVTHTIDLSPAVTVEDLLNILNGAGADVLAQLNSDGRTISVRSRLSGADFAIGENGGTTASDLGLRSLTTATELADLNHGLGVHTNAEGDDFIIRRKDGVELRFKVSPDATIGDVINQINTHPDNLATATRVVARLAVNGNGIELMDDGLANGQLTVLKVNNSQAAEDLGLIPVGETSVTTTAPASFATATLTQLGANNDILFTANLSGPQRNGVQIVFNDSGGLTDSANAVFDAGTNTLTIDYNSGFTTANSIISAIALEPAGTFTATLDTTADPGNDGSGLIGGPPAPGPLTTAGGTSEVLTGRDTNPQEVKGVFNSLLRLRTALRANDEVQTERSVALVEDDLTSVNFVRAEIGARQQSLEVLQTRLEDESINLQDALADEIEVDAATAISNLIARQATLQASLQLTGQLSRLTLLDYL